MTLSYLYGALLLLLNYWLIVPLPSAWAGLLKAFKLKTGLVNALAILYVELFFSLRKLCLQLMQECNKITFILIALLIRRCNLFLVILFFREAGVQGKAGHVTGAIFERRLFGGEVMMRGIERSGRHWESVEVLYLFYCFIPAVYFYLWGHCKMFI